MVAIEDEPLAPLPTSHMLMEGDCTVWVPPQRRTTAEHVLSAWSCAVEDEFIEILALWYQGPLVSSEMENTLTMGSLGQHELLNQACDAWGFRGDELLQWVMFDPQGIPLLKAIYFGKIEKRDFHRPLYNPRTEGDCLFMCILYSMSRMGVQVSPTELRSRVKKIWENGWTYLDGDAELWAIAAGREKKDFLESTTTTRWGMATDAIALARSFRVNVNIYGKNGTLIVRDRCSKDGGTIYLRLANHHYTVIDSEDVWETAGESSSFYLYREPTGPAQLRELCSLRQYLIARGAIRSCTHAPATKIREDPQGHPTGQGVGREASKIKDPAGQPEDPRWTPFGGRVGFFRSFPGPFACLGVVEIISVLTTNPAHMTYQGGMPTKVVPVQQQPEPLSEDERSHGQGHGPTHLVAPTRTRHQQLPKARNIVRAYVELAAPWRRGTCGDFGYVTLRVLQPEGPTYFRPASSKDRVFLRDIVPLGVNTSGSKKRSIAMTIEEEADLSDPRTPSAIRGFQWRTASAKANGVLEADVVLLPSSSTEVVQIDPLATEGAGPVEQKEDSQLPPLHRKVDKAVEQGEDQLPTSPTTSSSADSDDLFIIDRKDHFQE
eukprot:6486712-Amphidinium_carterae.1